MHAQEETVMYDIDRRRYDMLVRVRDFGASYGHLFPDTSLAAKAFTAVATHVGEIEAHDLAAASATVSARATRKREARDALIERLTLIGRTAQVLPDVDSEFRAHFVVPRETNDALLLTSARQFAKHAAAVTAQFVAHGMPSAFLEDLGTLIGNLEKAVRDRGMGRDEQMTARKRLKEAMAGGLAATRQLDVIVANHLASDSALRDVWKRNRRIEYPAPVRKGATKPASDEGEVPPAASEPPVAA